MLEIALKQATFVQHYSRTSSD